MHAQKGRLKPDIKHYLNTGFQTAFKNGLNHFARFGAIGFGVAVGAAHIFAVIG